MKIRSDLDGVVHVGDLVLAAGDTIPDGVIVGDHLTEGTAGASTGKRRGRAGTSRASTDE